jgi:hypothetical protein
MRGPMSQFLAASITTLVFASPTLSGDTENTVKSQQTEVGKVGSAAQKHSM